MHGYSETYYTKRAKLSYERYHEKMPIFIGYLTFQEASLLITYLQSTQERLLDPLSLISASSACFS